MRPLARPKLVTLVRCECTADNHSGAVVTAPPRIALHLVHRLVSCCRWRTHEFSQYKPVPAHSMTLGRDVWVRPAGGARAMRSAAPRGRPGGGTSLAASPAASPSTALRRCPRSCCATATAPPAPLPSSKVRGTAFPSASLPRPACVVASSTYCVEVALIVLYTGWVLGGGPCGQWPICTPV